MSRQSTILVVDDEPRNAKLLEALLITQGHTVVTAAGGAQALAIATEQRMDLILLDVMMPELDGFEVTRRLRQHPATRLTPIVLVTALRDTPDRITGIEAGCDDFISKPFDKHEVLARVTTLLRLSYYRLLLDQHEQLTYVMEHISDGIVVLDPQLRAGRLNARAAEWLELPVGAALVDHLQRFEVDRLNRMAEALPREPMAFDIRRPATDAVKELVLHASASPVFEPGGALSSVVVTLRDVTNERREEHLKADFLSLISHKLRTPIAVISSGASMLQDGLVGPLTDDQRQALATIQDKAAALARLIGQLLDFTTVDAQAGRPSATRVALADYLPRHLDAFAQRTRTKPVEWRVDCPDAALAVLANPAYLDVIIDSLLDNAVKFTDQPVAKIHVAAGRQGEHVAVAVTDNGRGVPPEEREQIFKPFYQVEKYFTGNVDGAGLGLALVRRLVAAHGGQVQLESALDRGSTFTIILPAANSHAA
jgi:signal transduction histidine kinase